MYKDEKDRISACIKNAKDLVKAAKAVISSESLPNIAFHLSIAAMEEIGKACLFRSLMYRTRPESWVRKRLDDHIEKLNYALLTPIFLKGHVTNTEISNVKSLANSLHLKRKEALYVAFDSDDFLRQISSHEAGAIVQIAEAKLEIEKMFSEATISPENLQDFDWFIDANSDEEKRGWIYSQESMTKLAQLNNDMRSWVKWLQQDSMNREKELQNLLQQELMRSKPGKEEASKRKWKFKIRLLAISHSVQQKILDEGWNHHSDWIKLSAAAEKKGNRELIFTFSLPNAVHIRDTWHIGYWPANLFVLALNIGSKGLFWWYSLNNQNTFYEEILDLDSNKYLKIKPENPALNTDWGNKKLETSDLARISLCFYALPKATASQEEQQPFAEYLRGLGFLAKTDIHLNLTPNACDLFFRSLKSGMKFYGDWDENTSFAEAFKKFFKEMIQQDEHVEELIKLSDRFEKGEKADFSDLTFDIVMQVKELCDVYFLTVFQKFAEKEITKLKLERKI